MQPDKNPAKLPPSKIRQKLLLRGARRARRQEKAAENATLDALARPETARQASNSRSTGQDSPNRATGRIVRRKAKAKKRPKLPTLKKLREILWDTLTAHVHKRDGDICRICKKNEGYALYHLVPQNEGDAVRYDPLNVVWGCRGCNCGENNYRARYARLHEQLFGKDYMDRLWEKSRRIVQLRRPELEAMIAEIGGELEG